MRDRTRRLDGLTDDELDALLHQPFPRTERGRSLLRNSISGVLLVCGFVLASTLYGAPMTAAVGWAVIVVLLVRRRRHGQNVKVPLICACIATGYASLLIGGFYVYALFFHESTR